MLHSGSDLVLGRVTTTNRLLRLLVVMFTGDGHSHPHASSGQIQWYKGSSVCKAQEL